MKVDATQSRFFSFEFEPKEQTKISQYLWISFIQKYFK